MKSNLIEQLDRVYAGEKPNICVLVLHLRLLHLLNIYAFPSFLRHRLSTTPYYNSICCLFCSWNRTQMEETETNIVVHKLLVLQYCMDKFMPLLKFISCRLRRRSPRCYVRYQYLICTEYSEYAAKPSAEHT